MDPVMEGKLTDQPEVMDPVMEGKQTDEPEVSMDLGLEGKQTDKPEGIMDPGMEEKQTDKPEVTTDPGLEGKQTDKPESIVDPGMEKKQTDKSEGIMDPGMEGKQTDKPEVTTDPGLEEKQTDTSEVMVDPGIEGKQKDGPDSNMDLGTDEKPIDAAKVPMDPGMDGKQTDRPEVMETSPVAENHPEIEAQPDQTEDSSVNNADNVASEDKSGTKKQQLGTALQAIVSEYGSDGFESMDNSDVKEKKDDVIEPAEVLSETAKCESTQKPTAPVTSGYEEQFANFLKQTENKQKEETDDASESIVNDEKGETKDVIKRKVFGEPVSTVAEESSNSSWYKIKDKKEEPMDVSVQDENSNASVVSSNIGDSNMSFPDQPSNVDEGSNLSAVSFSGHAPTFDESANLNPPSNVPFARPDTPSSVTADADNTPAKKPSRRGTMQIAADDANEHGHGLKASDIFEYQWPQEHDAELYILQEQISIYLDIKSFKRKYPDLQRRVCDKIEKDFLRDKGVVSETQSDLGLTALKSEDVHDLMSKDYPAKYKEFVKVLHERAKEDITNKMKEYVSETLQPKLEKEKIIEVTKRAMKSASDWNRSLLKEKNEERKSYFDMQTFTIQYPKRKFRKLDTVKTEVTAYPLSLIPGQFQDYYRSYTPEDLKYFPLNTSLFDPPKKLNPLERLQQQSEEDTESQGDEGQKTAGSVSGSDSEDDSSSSSSDSEQEEEEVPPPPQPQAKVELKKEKSSSREASKEKSAEPVLKKEPGECRICTEAEEKKKGKQKPKVDEELIQCSECKRNGHPSCLDLTDEMVKIIKTYPWQCMECKTCVECMDPYDEDKMMFCDKCDRGYHTFCVGLKSLPTGHWECKSCRGDSTPTKPIPRPTPKSRRGARRLIKEANGKATPSKEGQ